LPSGPNIGRKRSGGPVARREGGRRPIYEAPTVASGPEVA